MVLKSLSDYNEFVHFRAKVVPKFNYSGALNPEYTVLGFAEFLHQARQKAQTKLY